MPYIFPRRALKTGDVLDPEEMNADIVPAAEKYNGHLNEHDFNAASLFAGVDIAEGAYWSIEHAVVACDTGISGNLSDPNKKIPPTYALPSDKRWHVIDSATVTVTTGNSLLWINGFAQMVRTGMTTITVTGEDRWKPTNAQVAIRVDGRLLHRTRTGRRNLVARQWMPFRASKDGDRTTHTPYPGYAPWRLHWPAHSIGPHVAPLRTGTVIFVEPGEHVIELVARITPRGGRGDSTGDPVVFYNRRLVVLEAPVSPPAAQGGASLDVNTFQPEDALDYAGMYTNRVKAVADAYNDVSAASLARGALNWNHLPSGVVATAEAGAASSDGLTLATYTFENPGWSSPNVTTASPGWEEVTTAGLLYKNDDSLQTWDPSAGTIFIFANVVVTGLVENGTALSNGYRLYGLLRLFYTDSALNKVTLESTEALVNSFNPREVDTTSTPATDAQFPVHYSVPLLFVHKPGDGVLPSVVKSFGIAASTARGDDSAGCTMSIASVEFFAFQLRS